MSGSVSGSQNGSLASDATSRETGNVQLLRPGHEDDLMDDRAVSVGIMGVMYTVCKEKAVYGWLFVTFRLLADGLQLWLLMVNPLWFDIDDRQLWWQIVNFIQLNQFMAARGYTFFLGCFYTLLIGVVVSVVICVWVGYSFQANRFDHVWPIVFLRWFAKIFYQMLDIMSMTLFLMALDCQYFSRPKDQIYHNQQFPDYYCWGMPHVIHAAVAVVAVVVFVVLAGAFTVGEMELNITSRNPLAIMHTGVELETFILRTLMTLVSVFVNGFKWCSVAQLVLCTRLTWVVWYWQPQVVGWVNHVRVGMYASVWWSAVLFVVRAFSLGAAPNNEEDKELVRKLTIALWATFVPAGLAGALASWVWLRRLNTTVLGRFKNPPLDATPAEVCEFVDSRQVEVLMRCCRVWATRDQLDPEKVALAEAVVASGMAQLPNDPFMVILYSSFLIDVQSSYQSGYLQLQTAKKSHPSFLMRFAIFSREQQHTQKNGSGGSAGGPTDLVSYVEFQRNYSLALKVHREALASMRMFWERLLHRNIKFQTLANCIKRMDLAVRQAERVYKQVLSRHSSNVKMVRLYAKFLEQVKHDPWNAARWATEADKLEQVEEESKNRNAFHEMGTSPELRTLMMGLGGNLGNADGRGVVIINAQGIVQMANNGCEDIFGYSRAELHGKNVALLVPQPMSSMHQGFVRAYITTGRTRMMNRVSYQLGLRKDKRYVPLNATITRVSGIGEDTLIMGVMEEMHPAEGTATFWVGLDGEIMSCDEGATDWLAYTHTDVAGTNMANLVVGGSKILENALDRARAALLLAEHKQHRQDMVHAAETGSCHMGGSTLSKSRSIVVARSSMSCATLIHGEGVTANALLSGPSRAITRLFELANEGETEGVVGRMRLAHKYADPVEVEVSVANGGAGAMCYHVLTLKRAVPIPPHMLIPAPISANLNDSASSTNPSTGGVTCHVESKSAGPSVTRRQAFRHRRCSLPVIDPVNWPPGPDLMLVVDGQGRVLHCTTALAKSLGRTVPQVLGNGLANAVESLMVEPFDQLHRTLVANIPISAPPPHSCRSGLAVLMHVMNPQGRRVASPFRLHMAVHKVTEESVNVCTLQQCTLPFALDERRLVLEVDAGSGVVQSVSRSPATLFGFAPHTLVGMSVASCLDIFRTKPGSGRQPRRISTPEQSSPLRPFEEPGTSQSETWPPGPLGEGVEEGSVGDQLLEEAEVVEKLMELWARSGEGSSSVSWRVGVCPLAVDASGNKGKQPMPHSLKCPLPRPALLCMRRAPTAMRYGSGTGGGDASTATSGTPTLTLQLELWRADLVTSVVEVDSAGNVCVPRDPALATLYPPGLVLGAALDDMVEHHVSEYLHPLRTQPLTDLFEAGALGPAPSAPSTRRAVDINARRSLLKRKEASVACLRAGPQQVLTLRHRCDGDDLQVSVQAVRKNTGGLYILMHTLAPRAAPADFWARVTTPPDLVGGRLANEASTQDMVAVFQPFKRMNSEGPPLTALPPHLGLHHIKQAMLSGSGLSDARLSGRRGNVQWGSSGLGPSSPLKPKPSSPTSKGVGAWVTSNGAVAPGSVPDDIEAGVVDGDDDEGGLTEPGAGRRDGDGDSSVAAADVGDAGEAEEAAGNKEAVGALEDEVAEMPDEAGQEEHVPAESDLNRAQRFKKLFRVLTLGAIQRPIMRFHRHATVLMLGLAAVHIGLFVLMYVSLEQLNQDIERLAVIGYAAMAATETTVFSRTLNILYIGMGVPGLRIIGGYHDIPVLKQRLINTIKTFENLHAEVYLGKSGKDPQMSSKQGLAQLWDEPSVNITLFADISVDQTGGNFSRLRLHNQTKMVSLWEAGAALAGKAKVLWQTSEQYNLTLANHTGATFGDHPDLQWIVANGPSAVFPGYLKTMDSYVQVVIDESKSVNRLHLILLAVEGCALCAVCTLWVWQLLSKLASLRFSMYAVFMVVPQGLVRRLATTRHKLTEEEGEESDDDDINPKLLASKKNRQQQARDNANASSNALGDGAGAGSGNVGGGGGHGFKLHVKGASGSAKDIEARMSFSHSSRRAPLEFLAPLLCCLPGRRRVHASGGRRRLSPSRTASIWLVWPFLAFGALVVMADAVGYYLLSQVPAPIALFNIVSVVMVMYNRNNFYLQEMVYEQDPVKVANVRDDASNRIREFEREYQVMLYGREAAPPELANTPRYKLVTKGVVHSGSGNDILFNKDTCLIIDGSYCMPPDMPLYAFTASGLDRLVQRYIEIGETISQFEGLDPSITGPEYEFYWNTRPDFRGGLRQINNVFKDYVMGNVQSVITLHIIILVFVLLLCATYIVAMLRPFKKEMAQETRRMAELLSHLPSEVDVDALLASTLLADLGAAPVPKRASVAGNGASGGGAMAGGGVSLLGSSMGLKGGGQSFPQKGE